jgi:hypothetical protein
LNFRSNNGNILAAADDFGHVRVFEYPARQAQAPSREYREGLKSEQIENDFIVALPGFNLLTAVTQAT